jgi:hypothetical protein
VSVVVFKMEGSMQVGRLIERFPAWQIRHVSTEPRLRAREEEINGWKLILRGKLYVWMKEITAYDLRTLFVFSSICIYVHTCVYIHIYICCMCAYHFHHVRCHTEKYYF